MYQGMCLFYLTIAKIISVSMALQQYDRIKAIPSTHMIYDASAGDE